MWVYEEVNQERKWVDGVTSEMGMHQISKVTLHDARWVTGVTDKPYVAQSFRFSGTGGYRHDVRTYDTNGIIIENANAYEVKYVTDDAGEKTIVISLKEPLEDSTPSLLGDDEGEDKGILVGSPGTGKTTFGTNPPWLDKDGFPEESNFIGNPLDADEDL